MLKLLVLVFVVCLVPLTLADVGTARQNIKTAARATVGMYMMIVAITIVAFAVVMLFLTGALGEGWD